MKNDHVNKNQHNFGENKIVKIVFLFLQAVTVYTKHVPSFSFAVYFNLQV